jgi:cytochrome c oxidase subunit III
MLVGLVSLTFFFGALILAFGLRMEHEQTWRRFTVPGLLWLGTAALVISSWVLESGRHALRRALVSIYRGRLFGTLALAVIFLGVQAAAARDLMAQGVAASGNPHGSAFYLFMGIHGVHLGGGIAWLVYLYRKSGRLFSGTETDLRIHRRALAAAAMYWHFMGALWLVLYYFLRHWSAG